MITIKDEKYLANNRSKIIDIHQSILAKNDHIASHNRDLFKAKNIYTFNVLSSPGSGKTTLIEKTLTDLKNIYQSAVIVGDLATDNDAQRLQKSEAQVIQITTGDVCHLEADMINKALQKINLDECQLLIIENVGNLVCPAVYDLGEHQRIAILSVTEGEDKPLKYPTLFKTADVVIINKMDIAQAVEFNLDLALDNIKAIAPQSKVFLVSARTGEGMQDWYEYITDQLKKPKFTL
jgi:hydrogenase nickel incorporation protein HypB